MFEGYRKLLKIVCSENWNTDKNHKEINSFLDALESILTTEPKWSVFSNLISKLLQIAFRSNDVELLYLVINAIIGFDEISEKDEDKTSKKIREIEPEKIESPVEQESISEEKIDEEDDEVLSKSYGTLIKKRAIKEILSKIKKDFSINDLEEIITNYYRNILKSKASDRGIQTYANSYIRFLTDFDLCRRDNIPEYTRPKRGEVIYHFTGKNIKDIAGKSIKDIKDLKKLEKNEEKETERKIGRSSLSEQAQYIILWTEKNGTDIVDINAIYLHKLPSVGENYRLKDIYEGLDELVEKGIATRFSKKRYAIKSMMLRE